MMAGREDLQLEPRAPHIMNFPFIRVESRKMHTVEYALDSDNLNPEPSGTEAKPHNLTLPGDPITNIFNHITKTSMGPGPS
jgi:hypothetical protein